MMNSHTAPMIDRQPARQMLIIQLIFIILLSVFALLVSSTVAINLFFGGLIAWCANFCAVFYAFYSRMATNARFKALVFSEIVKFSVVVAGFVLAFKTWQPLQIPVLFAGFVAAYAVGVIGFLITLKRK